MISNCGIGIDCGPNLQCNISIQDASQQWLDFDIDGQLFHEFIIYFLLCHAPGSNTHSRGGTSLSDNVTKGNQKPNNYILTQNN